jgi:glycine betaine/choline ABC-type transport system substrate-binding protein
MCIMKKFIIIVSVLLLWVPGALSCTNFPINIGAMDTLQGRILVESMALLITERTGLTVGIHYFKAWEDMDKAVAEARLEIIIEDTSNGLRRLDMAVGDDPQQNLETLKELYKIKEMFWLEPFAFRTADEKGLVALTAPVISIKSLSQFPALPRLIGKLSKKVDNQALQQLVQGLQKSEKPPQAARDFLISQNLI